MSTVWMLAHVEGDRPPRMKIIADSDSQIVRGLIVILLSLYQGRTPTEVLEIDAEKTLAQLGLAQHLSPNRRNGLFAMVKHIRVLAAGQLAARTNPAGASS
jgi:cysteine desulfuration protein SufE